MFEALILTLREGVEAALVVGIIVAFLRKEEGGEPLLKAVWSGLATAVLASVGGAYLLYRVAVNEEAFEGILYVTSAVMVATLVIWMWRHSHALGEKMRGSMARILGQEHRGLVFAGIFLFTFLMVFREGLETAFFLSALSLTSSGLLAFLGATIGLVVAVAFGVLFVRGSVRVDLGRFFKVTGIALLIFVFQLLLNGYHELSEAGWVPATPETMAIIGPLVRNEFFFIAAVLLIPLLLLFIPGRPGEGETEAEGGAPSAAASRLERAKARRFQRARYAAGALGITVLVFLSLGTAYSQPPAPSPAIPVDLSSGEVRLPLERFADGDLHRYVARIGDRDVRFFGIEVDEGEVTVAFDACLICGDKGYIQDGGVVTCLHCHSAIHPPTIGQPGGCNPIPLDFRVEGDEVVIAASELKAEADRFSGDGEHADHSGHAGG